MPYSYKEIPEADHAEAVFTDDGESGLHEIAELRTMNQYEILDEQGDQIAVVYAEVDAEALISHLNR